MGCNTSSEANTKEVCEEDTNNDVLNVEQTNGKETPCDIIKHETEKENEDSDNNNDGDTDEKSESARTITLRSSGSNSVESIRAELGSVSDHGPEAIVTIEHQNSDFIDIDAALAEEQAATKIQAVFRGHHTRKNMKQADNPVEPEATKEQLEAEFRADDEELCHAATKIQASFRGHMARKTKEGEPATTPMNNAEEELDIDLSDPDLSKAAVKIQASFRGHMARKEHDN